MSDMTVKNEAAQANAETLARSAARDLGNKLMLDAANFGKGVASQMMNCGTGASSASNTGSERTSGSVASR